MMDMEERYRLFNSDCLKVMDKLIEDGVKVDSIICDPPFGTTACKWDSVIPFDEMWERLNKLIKPNGAIVLFGSEPFSSHLRMSNIKNYKYDWIWDKTRGTNFQLAKKMPMKSHENICVFYKKQPTYNPQFWYDKPYKTSFRERRVPIEGLGLSSASRICSETISEDGRRYPLSIQTFKRDSKRVHPTQKPVELLEYLIKTYTNENEIVLDFTMGSGSTGVACINTNRKFIGIELDNTYFNIAKERIENAELENEQVN